ncbi:MAG: methylthioribulose 1-phosphate dehydratase [Cellvibrionaceae bacterium]
MARMAPWLKLYRDIFTAGDFLYRMGWSPATSGEISIRLKEDLIAISAAGREKHLLSERDIISLDLKGEGKHTRLHPPAGAPVHAALYQLDENINAILHFQTVETAVLPRLIKDDYMLLDGWDMQNTLIEGDDEFADYAMRVFDGNQSPKVLAEQLRTSWQIEPLNAGFIVRGAGLYVWGKSMEEAQRRAEALEFLMSCELELRKAGGS